MVLTCVLIPQHRYACLYGHLIPRPSVGVSSIISIHKLLLSMYYMCAIHLFFFPPTLDQPQSIGTLRNIFKLFRALGFYEVQREERAYMI